MSDARRSDGRPYTGPFNDAQVIAIREEYARGGVSQYQLAARYRVDQQCISAMVRGETYAHVGGPRTSKARDLVIHARGRNGGRTVCGERYGAVGADEAVTCATCTRKLEARS